MSTNTTPEPIVPDRGVLDPDNPRLNIGGGPVPLPGYLTHDALFGDDATVLPYPDGSFDEVYASHVLEHLDWKTYHPALTEWVRVLRPGGRIRISVPDLTRTLDFYNRPEVRSDLSKHPSLGFVIMGGQTDANDYHKSVWDTADLKYCLRGLGLVCVREFQPFAQDCSQYQFCANVEGTKPTETMLRAADDNVAIAMSVPRLGFTSATKRLIETVMLFQATSHMRQGAYFDICMEKAIQLALASGRKYIFTIDYDTIVEPDDLKQLVMMMDLHADYDALAAVQMRRGEHRVLVTGFDGQQYDIGSFSDEVVHCRTACFGLTCFRRECFEKMPYPWMRHRDTHDDNGNWVQTIEADMSFWEKFNEHGLKLGMATGVCVGHLEEFIAWPGRDYKVVLQPVGDYNEQGRSAMAHA